MNIKKLFGAILTLLGIAGLIYTATIFIDTSGSTVDIKSLIIYGVLGFLFFIIGLGLPTLMFLHLLTHAFFKSCLFLQVGVFIH